MRGRQHVKRRREEIARGFVAPDGQVVAMRSRVAICRGCGKQALVSLSGLCLPCLAIERTAQKSRVFLQAALDFDPAR